MTSGSSPAGDDPHAIRSRPAGDVVPGRPVRVPGALPRTVPVAERPLQ
ncbi:hypothetical protein ACI79C_20605 [Geodermatophilus sp. SYSU D00697]